MESASLFDLAPFHDADAATRNLAIYRFEDGDCHWVLAQSDEQAWDYFRSWRRQEGFPVEPGERITMRWCAPGEKITDPGRPVGVGTKAVASWLEAVHVPGHWLSAARDA